MDLALNNLQKLTCDKIQTTNHKGWYTIKQRNQIYMHLDPLCLGYIQRQLVGIHFNSHPAWKENSLDPPLFFSF